MQFYKNDDMLCDNITDVINTMNKTLSTINPILSTPINDNIIEWKINDDTYKLVYTTPIDKKYLPYFLFNKDTITTLDEEYISNIINLNPRYLADVFTQKCLSDPYHVITKVFKLGEELIYQTYIHYLNKTISVADDITKIDLTQISKCFFINNDAPANKYNTLLLKYLKQRSLPPFIIIFKQYTPIKTY